jgi:hypothetical protein
MDTVEAIAIFIKLLQSGGKHTCNTLFAICAAVTHPAKETQNPPHHPKNASYTAK